MRFKLGACLAVLALGIVGGGCGHKQRHTHSDTGAPSKDNAPQVNADAGEKPVTPPDTKPPVKGDEKPKADAGAGAAITVDEHAFVLPAAWKEGKPSNAMRKFQADVPKSGGDTENAELVISKAGGGVDANIKRWAGQFGGEASLKNKYEVKTAGGITATVAELEGSYAAMTMGGPQPPKDNFKQLGAIITTPDGDYFLKLTGPKKTVDDNKAVFDAMLATFK